MCSIRILDLSPPTRGIKKFRTESRERFLSPEERAEIDAFLENALTLRTDQPGRLRWQSVAALRLLALTGMRRDEVRAEGSPGESPDEAATEPDCGHYPLGPKCVA